jgi:ribosome maturation factor RimP
MPDPDNRAGTTAQEAIVSDDARRDAVARIIEPVVVAAGYDLDEVSLAQAGRRIVVRVAVDADHPINLDAVADISREISDALDAGSHPPLGDDPYTLEVGSRGVSAPLLLERHWRRNIGRLVLITFTDKTRPKLTGRVVAATAQNATLTVDGGEQTIAYADIRRASVQVEFTKSVAGSVPENDHDEDDQTDDVDDETDDDQVDDETDDDEES